MIRRFRFAWPDQRPFVGRDGRPIRFLAASDETDPALEHEVNRTALGPIDGVIGCGDLEPHWLSFLADAFHAPLVYVRGNHDRGGAWEARHGVPMPLGRGDGTRLAGIAIAGLEWPGVSDRGSQRRGGLAWAHAVRLALRAMMARLRGRTEPFLVISHAPPAGAGDSATDAYHLGFRAYRWLMDRLRPPLWLHGHTTTASVKTLEAVVGATTLVNVTGAVLVELLPPHAAAA
jgi:uncharacterized protein